MQIKIDVLSISDYPFPMKWYKPDLAYIHDVGFSDYALNSTPEIIELLKQQGIPSGLVVDLGCGSGLSAQTLTQAGYRVLGIDISEAMIAIARRRVPNAEFRVESLFTADLPRCNAVISIGECLNYLFDANDEARSLLHLFQRIYQALTPGGVFIFDISEPGQVTETTKGFVEGTDWIVLVEKAEDPTQKILTRRIITFRKQGEQYRRNDEVHRQQLYEATEIATELTQVGFQVQRMRSYGQYHLPQAHAAFIACKPK